MLLYYLNKKGTIVVGHMRSGSQYLLSLVKLEVQKNNIEFDDNGEYFKDIFSVIKYTNNCYSFLNIIDKIKEQDASTSYSVGTIVYPNSLDMISQHKANYKYFSDNYHLIKMIRKDVMAQFMSYMIFVESRARHSGIQSIDEVKINTPYTADSLHIIHYLNKLLELERFKADTTVYYEDLPHLPTPGLTKNNYNMTPKEFFKNYDDIINQINELNITHYER
jgi:hypothetical protein